MVSNPDVVRSLERIADLLEIRGENQFKVRAYRQAAVQIENLGRSLQDIAATDEGLRSVDGFGPAIAEKVGELVRNGRSTYLEGLEAEVPPTLLEIRALPGIGPRTASMLWHDAGILTLDQLDAAAHSGGLVGLPRLSTRSIEKIVEVLDARDRRGGAPPQRRARNAIADVAATLCAGLAGHPAALRAEIAGSFRRERESCGDLDILVATHDAPAVLIAFATLPQVEKVLARGDTKSSVHVAGGFQVDCRAVPLESFGAALQYFTGSQAHNIRLRSRALRMGLMLNEYGVFRTDDHTRIAGDTEAGVYAALALPWIPPQRREDPTEIEAPQPALPHEV